MFFMQGGPFSTISNFRPQKACMKPGIRKNKIFSFLNSTLTYFCCDLDTTRRSMFLYQKIKYFILFQASFHEIGFRGFGKT